MATAFERVKESASTADTDTLVVGLAIIGGSLDVTPEARIVRAAYLEVISDREGDAAAESIMDELGM